MKLEELRDRHAGETIYIVGSGPSLDQYDLSFLRGAVTIAVNWSYRNFPEASYHITKHHETSVKCLNETTATVTVVSRRNSSHLPNPHDLETEPRAVLFDHPTSNKSGPINWKPADVGDTKLMVSWSTITSAMHLAAFMGASTVVLVGYDGGVFPAKRNVNGYERRRTPDIFHKHRYWAFVDQTLEARDLLESAYPVQFISLSPYLGFDLEGTAFIGRFDHVNLATRQRRRAQADMAVYQLFRFATRYAHRLQLALTRRQGQLNTRSGKDSSQSH